MVVCGPRNNYASRNSSSHYRRLGDRRARRFLLEVDPIRTECRKRVYALPSAVVGFTNSKMRPMRVDRMPSMLGERPELPALQGDQAAGDTRCPSPAQGLTLNSTKSGSRHLSQSARLRCIVNARAERNPHIDPDFKVIGGRAYKVGANSVAYSLWNAKNHNLYSLLQFRSVDFGVSAPSWHNAAAPLVPPSLAPQTVLTEAKANRGVHDPSATDGRCDLRAY